MIEITHEQLEELKFSQCYDTKDEFHRLLKEYTGIEARPYTAFQYYDIAGNYVGDSNDDTALVIANLPEYCEGDD